jgi:hypothetical protein
MKHSSKQFSFFFFDKLGGGDEKRTTPAEFSLSFLRVGPDGHFITRREASGSSGTKRTVLLVLNAMF